MIRRDGIELREYQVDLYRKSLGGNTLIVLPTGLGKTAIAALVTARKLENGGCKVLALAPTKPLVGQLERTFRRMIALEEGSIVSLTGEDQPVKRVAEWVKAKVIVSTPQVVKNDLLSSRYSLKDVCLVIFDEAHRAVGGYPYVYIAKKYLEESPNPHILALTASPGSSPDQIKLLCENLGILNVYFKSRDDPDVKKYVQRLSEETVVVDPPAEFASVANYLNILLEKFVKPLKEEGLINYKDIRTLALKKLVDLQKSISEAVAKEGWTEEHSRHAGLVANSIRVAHAISLLETQGVSSTLLYIRRVEETARRHMSSSIRTLITDPFWVTAKVQLETLQDQGVIHPKLPILVSLLEDHFNSGGKRAIVFTNYRDTANLIMQALEGNQLIRPARFVGQADRLNDRGLTQKEQAGLLEDFRLGRYNVLVATQVAEEGLDIPECDLVVMYDNVPSPLRLIQRVGRTGRVTPGRVVHLVTKNTRDEVYHYIAKRRSRKVAQTVKNSVHIPLEGVRAQGAQNSVYSGVRVIVDVRESNSDVAVQLSMMGVTLQMEKLEVADYVVSDEICIERKTVQDFTSSVVDGRLFSQALNMRRSYRKPLIIVEGENIYSSTLNPESIRGALVSLAVDYGIPLLWSRSPKETALLIGRVALREQKEMGSKPIVRDSRKPVDEDELKEYVVASLPGVDAVRARRLLKHFGSVLRVFNATREELEAVEGIGKATAEKIKRIVEEAYRGREEPSSG